MHFGTDRNLTPPPDDPAEPGCGCPCGCSEPETPGETLAGENLYAKVQAASDYGLYLVIHGTGAPSQ